MNYLSEERRHALCSEYVLGTMNGRARRRFQQLLMLHPELRLTLWHWESRMNELGGSVEADMPHPRVWQKIQLRLGHDAQSDKVVSLTDAAKQAKPPVRWTWLSAVAAVMLFALVAIYQPWTAQDLAHYERIAVVQSEDAGPLWFIELGPQEYRARATQALQASPNNDYELWMLASDGRAPVSLGLLPKLGQQSYQRHPLMDEIEIAALAVSLEPLGGSPNGSPTTVLYSAELVQL